jgi:hypothetical protein
MNSQILILLLFFICLIMLIYIIKLPNNINYTLVIAGFLGSLMSGLTIKELQILRIL